MALTTADARVPQQILAMAKKPAPPAVPSAQVDFSKAPQLSVVPPPAAPAPLSRAEIELRAPEILNAAKAEGHAAGVAAERARLKAIDELAVRGADDLVMAAKYGEQPSDASALAVAVLKAGKVAGAELLAARRVESRVIAEVTPDVPDKTAATQEAALINLMVQGGNSRRGGKR